MYNIMFKGYPVDTAHNAQVAVNRLTRNRYDAPEECRNLSFWTIEKAGMPCPNLTKNLAK